MAQLIIDTGAAANDGQGDPLRTAFTDTNLNFTAIYTAGPVDSNVQIINNTISTIDTNGNLVLSPNGTGKVVANVDVVPNTANVRNLGSATLRWSTAYTQYLDVSADITAANITATGFVKLPVYTVSAINAVTGQVGWTAAVSDSTPGGSIAFWDTTNSRWSYVSDNSAV